MDYKKQFEDYLKSNFKRTDFEIDEIKEDNANVYCYTYGNDGYDCPKLVLNKETNKIDCHIIPLDIDDSKAKTIYKSPDRFDETEDSDYDI